MAGVDAGKEGRHGHNLGFLFWRERHLPEIVYVAVVHADDEVEVGEVGQGDAPTYMGEVIAPAACVGPHAWIGKVAGVVTLGAGRVDEEGIGVVVLVDDVLENAVGGGRTADIAETHEQYPHGTAVVER